MTPPTFLEGGNIVKKIIALFAALVLVVVGFGFIPAFADNHEDPEPCVPSEAWTETTGWVLESPGDGWYEVDQQTVTDKAGYTEDSGWVLSAPAGDGWVLVDEKTVVDKAAYDEQVFDYWQRYSWNGPWESNTVAPPFPDERWQPNVKGDPHGVGVEGAYFRSNGNSGNGDWFYLEAVEKTVHHEAETHKEFRYEREVPPVTHVEYKFAFDHEAVTCDDEPTEVTPAAPTFTDPCGTENDDWAWPESDQTEVKYELTTVDGVVGVLATDANPDDEFVIKADAQVFWPATWTDRECPVDNPDNPDTPDNPETPVDIPTSVPAGVPSAESKCLGGALVTKSTDAKGNITTSTVNGHPDCAPENGEVFKEEGM